MSIHICAIRDYVNYVNCTSAQLGLCDYVKVSENTLILLMRTMLYKLCHYKTFKICYINLTLKMNLCKCHFPLENVYFKVFLVQKHAIIYLVKVIYRNTRTKCELCLLLTIKTPE